MTSAVRKYSKSSMFYMHTKKEFFEENESLLKKVDRQNQIYKEQPRRNQCKLCATRLSQFVDHVSRGISYYLCVHCGHLNGAYEDTKDFIQKVYVEDASYADDYTGQAFKTRTKNIYMPKLDFLLENLSHGVSPVILDVGCGGGHFVYACLQRNISASGIDFVKQAIDVGNNQIHKNLGQKPLMLVSEETFIHSITQSKANILSVIGVIEHLREPYKFFEAFRQSKITYLFYSVPMFSSSVIFEHIFPAVFPRQLARDHTHLFTESSLQWMHSHNGLTSVAEWRFGTDIMDLYRSLLISLNKNGVSDKLLKIFENGFGRNIDALQAVLDQSNFCSEIHCLTKKEN